MCVKFIPFYGKFCDILPVSSMMGDALLCFSCCITEQPQPKRRRRLDPSMIGQPTDFRHCGHIGSSDVGQTLQLNTAQTMMSSKEPQEQVSPLNVHLNLIELPAKNHT